MIRNRIYDLFSLSFLLVVPCEVPLLQAGPLEASLNTGGSQSVQRSDYAEQSAHLKKHEKNLKRMQATRSLDNEHTRKAKEEFRKGTADMSDHDEQQLQDVQDLRVVEGQVAAGRKQRTTTHQSYNDAAQKYGAGDPRSVVAKGNWKESQQEMGPLLASQRSLKEDIHRGGRQLHNDGIVLDLQQRDMNSDARYRAMDDRNMQREEKTIANDRRAMIEQGTASQQPDSRK